MTTIKFDKRGMPDIWTERQLTLTDNCIKKIADEVVKRLNDKDEIVRCKDCKYWNKHHFVDIYVCSIHNKEGRYPYLLFEMSADDFCSRGERKDD